MSKPITLPEIFAWMRVNSVSFEDACAHFKAQGRISASAPLPPIHDGWRPPAVEFRLSDEASRRADERGERDLVFAAARTEFETLMLDAARRRIARGDARPVLATDIVFSCFAVPPGDLESGYAIVPIDFASVLIDAARFTTIGDIEDFDVQTPIVSLGDG